MTYHPDLLASAVSDINLSLFNADMRRLRKRPDEHGKNGGRDGIANVYKGQILDAPLQFSKGLVNVYCYWFSAPFSCPLHYPASQISPLLCITARSPSHTYNNHALVVVASQKWHPRGTFHASSRLDPSYTTKD
ncbi:hypothetical protein RU639_004018 [Aspergillus parasiticus]